VQDLVKSIFSNRLNYTSRLSHIRFLLMFSTDVHIPMLYSTVVDTFLDSVMLSIHTHTDALKIF